MKAGVTGTALAIAAATMFLASHVQAQESAGSGGAAAAQVKCVGANDCKGKSACKTASSPGPGQNSCKGQGMAMASNEKACTDKGGHVEKE